MANDTTNENLEKNPLENESLDEDNVNIDDIEGLEKDIASSVNSEEESVPEEKKEILYDDGPRLEDRLQAIEDSIEKKPVVQNIPEEEQYIEGTELPSKKEGSQEEDDVEIVHHSEDEESEEELPQKLSLKEKLKDKKNLVKLLIAVLIFLLIIIALIFMFLPGKKEQPAKSAAAENTKEQVQQVQQPVVQTPTYEFKLDHINVTKVNKQLEKLTKYELLGMSEEEYLRQEKLKAEQKAKEEAARLEQERIAKEEAQRLAKEEAERLEQERIAKEEAQRLAKEEAEKLAAQEATQNTQAQQEQSNNPQTEQNGTSQEANSDDTMQGNTFLKFVHVPTYKKTLYKTELAKIKDIDARINPCRNSKNFIEIFVGPLNNDEQYSDIVNALQQKANYKNITMLELTKDEFETRCMVY